MHIHESDFTWDMTQYCIYYGANALFALFVGILAGLKVKKRFYGPFFTAICLLPTVLLFRWYISFIDWFCVVTTLIVGVSGMVLSAVVTKKKSERKDVETSASDICAKVS